MSIQETDDLEKGENQDIFFADIMTNQRITGHLSYHIEDDTAFFSLNRKPSPNQLLALKHFFSCLNIKKAQFENLCFVPDPLYRSMPKEAFDSEGYIINQGIIENVPYGKYKSSDKGCGWMATYNYLHMQGDDNMSNIKNQLEKHLPFHGLIGTPLLVIYLYLKKRKPDAHIKIVSLKRIDEIKQNGIVLYFHRKGAHLFAYRHLPLNKQLYNAYYGLANHRDSLYNHLKKESVLPFAWIIY